MSIVDVIPDFVRQNGQYGDVENYLILRVRIQNVFCVLTISLN
jgi:hypothetical protein